MGYPIEMIDKETSLYAYIGVDAIEQKKDELFNQHLKNADFNAKIMPLNIREDDIGFFIYGFKDSQIKEGYFSKEYWYTLHDLLDNISEEAKMCGVCDTIKVINKQNFGELYYGRAVVLLFSDYFDIENATVAIYGCSALTKSILFNLVTHSPKQTILADMVIENTLQLSSMIPPEIDSDIQRVEIDSLDADIIINSETGEIKIGDTQIEYEQILEKIAEIKTKEWII